MELSPLSFECPVRILKVATSLALERSQDEHLRQVETLMEEHRLSDQKFMKWLPRFVHKWVGLPRTDDQILSEITQGLDGVKFFIRKKRIEDIETFLSMVETTQALYGDDHPFVLDGDWYRILQPFLRHVLTSQDTAQPETAPTQV